MPSPSTSLATLRPDLGGSLMAYDLDMAESGFIGHRVLPEFNTQLQAGPIPKIPIEQILNTVNTQRTSRSGYNRGSFQFESDMTYSCVDHGFEFPVDDRNAAMYVDYFDAELLSATMARDKVKRNAEIRAAALLYSTATFSGAKTSAITHEWDDHTNATPIDDVIAAKLAVYNASGIWPNALVLNKKQFLHLRECDQIISRLKYSGHTDPKSASITAEIIAQVFDLEEVIVAGESKNSANEGQAASISQIWSDEYAMVCRVSRRTTDIVEPCVGRTFHWAADGSQIGGVVETYRDETIRGDVVRVRHDVHEKVLMSELGHLLSNVLTI